MGWVGRHKIVTGLITLLLAAVTATVGWTLYLNRQLTEVPRMTIAGESAQTERRVTIEGERQLGQGPGGRSEDRPLSHRPV